jgi:hypothetical protein
MKKTPDIMFETVKYTADEPIYGPDMQIGFSLNPRTLKNDFDLSFSLKCYDGEFRVDRIYYMEKEGLIRFANFILKKVAEEEAITADIILESLT